MGRTGVQPIGSTHQKPPKSVPINLEKAFLTVPVEMKRKGVLQKNVPGCWLDQLRMMVTCLPVLDAMQMHNPEDATQRNVACLFPVQGHAMVYSILTK